MGKITSEIVEQINNEVSSENFEEIVDKYNLDTPEKYSHIKLCEQDGVEVWGISEDKEILVYDSTNGFYLLSEIEWINEVKKVFPINAKKILKDLNIKT